MGTDAGDYDGDGRLDLVVTNFESEAHSVFRNLGGGLFADATFESGVGPATLPFLGFGALFLDYDNDTRLIWRLPTDTCSTTRRSSARRRATRSGSCSSATPIAARFVEVGRQSRTGIRRRDRRPQLSRRAISITTAISIC